MWHILQHTATHRNTLQNSSVDLQYMTPESLRDMKMPIPFKAKMEDLLRCVAACCSVLQHVAVCCSMLQCVAVCCNSWGVCLDGGSLEVCCSVLQCVAACCSMLQCVAECCSVLQCAAVCYSVLQWIAVRCSVCCSVLQCAAVCCSVLQVLHCTSSGSLLVFESSTHALNLRFSFIKRVFGLLQQLFQIRLVFL